jgi:hypothetical protein
MTRYATIVRKTLKVLIVIDAGKCFGPPPPGETVLQNCDFTTMDCRFTGYFIINM